MPNDSPSLLQLNENENLGGGFNTTLGNARGRIIPWRVTWIIIKTTTIIDAILDLVPQQTIRVVRVRNL
jgi:hypothetical protein